MTAGPFRIAVDIGGTFVDAVEFDEGSGRTRLAKASTTPALPVHGVMEAVRRLGTPLARTSVFVHGTTLGLNAVLQRRGARTGLIANEGFRDLIEIARADVPPQRMYDLHYTRPPALVPRRHRLGVPGRLDATGREVLPLDEAALLAAVDRLVADGVQALALSFLHAWCEPAHERRAAELIRARHPRLPLSVGHEVVSEYREVERSATVVLDAYIRPIFETYIEALEGALGQAGFGGRFLVMRSSGGAMTAGLARRSPLATLLSGPAGGIVGALQIAQASGRQRLITLDYGGTSLDASVIEDGRPLVMHETRIEQLPVLMPVFDIRCIGTGGGSIASVEHGLLKAGPLSAGADPGPMAYGKGGSEPTTTDAAIVLGYLDPAGFLDGKLPLDGEAAHRGIAERLAGPLGCTPLAAAAGVFDVLAAKTVGAVREITVERGKDPREFSLLAFGGAGPLIAPLIARELPAAELIVPRVPAVFSAWGMLFSDLVGEFSQTRLAPLDEAAWDGVLAAFARLEARGHESLDAQQVPPARRRMARALECRYAGQEHCLEVELGPGDRPAALVQRFAALHRERYGHALAEPVECVTLRLRAAGELARPALARETAVDGNGAQAVRGRRPAYCMARRALVDFVIYDRHRLVAGDRFAGPAIVDEGTSTTVIHGDQRLRVDELGQLIVTGEPA